MQLEIPKPPETFTEFKEELQWYANDSDDQALRISEISEAISGERSIEEVIGLMEEHEDRWTDHEHRDQYTRAFALLRGLQTLDRETRKYEKKDHNGIGAPSTAYAGVYQLTEKSKAAFFRRRLSHGLHVSYLCDVKFPRKEPIVSLNNLGSVTWERVDD